MRVVDYFAPKSNFFVSNLAWTIMTFQNSQHTVFGNDASSYLLAWFYLFKLVIERAVYRLSRLSRVGLYLDFRNFFVFIDFKFRFIYVTKLSDWSSNKPEKINYWWWRAKIKYPQSNYNEVQTTVCAFPSSSYFSVIIVD